MVVKKDEPHFAGEWLDTCQMQVLLIVDDSVSVTETEEEEEDLEHNFRALREDVKSTCWQSLRLTPLLLAVMPLNVR